MSAKPPEDDPREPELRPGDSVLDSIGARTGRSPKVSLTETGDEAEAPLVDPRVRQFQDQLRTGDKYQVLGEIAKGGMGVVLRGHDRELGRDVALKVVHEEFADRPDVLERFVEEAQIGGQLQHPGIVPVYEMGLLGDQRPYFTMKLIKGRTLAKMLARRKSVDEDRVRFLSIFEAVCQTMAYAHSKGVIHRDLKPANVMVGAFGEIQVVDWGLSKVLRSGGVEDELAAQRDARTVIETVRSGPQSGSDSLAGNVLGTPAYMAPEQAQGKVADLDERADVFALGSLLCEILTGAPAYVAGEGESLVRMAAAAELDDAHARLDAASASEDLKKICRACLMPAKQARPGSADELAQVVHEHIANLETAAHAGQLAAAEQRVRAERSRRRLQLTVVAAILVLAGVGGWAWLDQQRADRMSDLTASLDEVRASVASLQSAGDLQRAVDEARAGERLIEAGAGDARLRKQAAQVVASAEQSLRSAEVRAAEVARDKALYSALEELEMVQVQTGVAVTDDEIDARYARAFADYGLALDAPDLPARLAELRDTELGLRIALGFDAWSQVLRRMGLLVGAGRSEELELLTGIGLDLDSDPDRQAVRLALVAGDDQQLLDLAKDPKLSHAAPQTLSLLGQALWEREHKQASLAVLTRGAALYPTDFLLNFGAAYLLYDIGNYTAAQYERCAGYLRAAMVVRPDEPDLCSLLGDMYRTAGDAARAAHWCARAVELEPEFRWNYDILGWDLLVLGRFEQALGHFNKYADRTPFARRAAEYCEVELGLRSREELVASGLAEVSLVGPHTMVFPGLSLVLPRGGLAPDPARARELLAAYLPDGSPRYVYWVALAASEVLLGRGEDALWAAGEAQQHWGPVDRGWAVLMRVIVAAGHRLTGDDQAAKAELERAREERLDLIAGMEDEWRDSYLFDAFAMFEAIAEGR